MRTILFRGKSCDSGEWLYGDLINEGSDCYIVDSELEGRKVSPETVGQYVKIGSAVGRVVFEGDIVDCKTKSDEVREGTICYSDALEAYYLKCADSHSDRLLNELRDFEVIGDIFDGLYSFKSSEGSEDDEEED